MKFSIGQKVVFLHERGGGVIKTIEGARYIIEDEDGFDRSFQESELGLQYSNDYGLDEEKIQAINEDESFSQAKHHVTQGVLTASKRSVEMWELDLHIEELTDSHANWSNSDIVRKQITELKTFFNKARARRIRKLVIIHGVGSGVLKEEVRSFLHGKDGVEEVYDADYSDYGKGATAVELVYK